MIWGTELVIPTLSACFTPIVYGALTGATLYGGYKLGQVVNKNTDVYIPDRKLPNDKYGKAVPDTDAPHTQLGIRESKRRKGEKYPQAREFDKDGKPVRDIDFTDHSEPNKHPNPHQHRWVPNETGGSLKRNDPELVPEWIYE